MWRWPFFPKLTSSPLSTLSTETRIRLSSSILSARKQSNVSSLQHDSRYRNGWPRGRNYKALHSNTRSQRLALLSLPIVLLSCFALVPSRSRPFSCAKTQAPNQQKQSTRPFSLSRLPPFTAPFPLPVASAIQSRLAGCEASFNPSERSSNHTDYRRALPHSPRFSSVPAQCFAPSLPGITRRRRHGRKNVLCRIYPQFHLQLSACHACHPTRIFSFAPSFDSAL